MANVIFKRGLQNSLNPNVASQDGVFYLTTDTGRLYVDVDQGNGQLKRHLLNQAIQFVANIAETGNSHDSLQYIASQWTTEAEKTAHINDLYYVTSENILAVYTKTGTSFGWTQINPDSNTTNDKASYSLSVAPGNKSSTITLTIEDSADDSVTATFGIETTGGITVSSNTNTNALVLNAPTYELDRRLDGQDGRTAVLQLKNSGGTGTPSELTLLGENITFSTSVNGALKLKAQDTTLTENSLSTSITSTGALSITIEDSEHNTSTSTLNNLGVALVGGSGNLYAPIVENAGKTAGEIYSKAEIDSILSGLNGMRFRGTVNAGPDLPTQHVSVGDVYVITSNNLTVQGTFSGRTFNSNTLVNNEFPTGSARIGDMLIAQGTEDSSGEIVNIEWFYVPSGDDTLDSVTYSASHNASLNKFRIQNVYEETLGSLVLNAGTDITINSVVDSDDAGVLSTTISHAIINTSTTALSAASTTSYHASQFTAIKNISTSNGHVTNIELDTFTPVEYNLLDATTTATSAFGANNTGTATMDVSIRITNSNNDTLPPSHLYLNSETIKLSATANGVIMNLEWGTF